MQEKDFHAYGPKTRENDQMTSYVIVAKLIFKNKFRYLSVSGTGDKLYCHLMFLLVYRENRIENK